MLIIGLAGLPTATREMGRIVSKITADTNYHVNTSSLVSAVNTDTSPFIRSECIQDLIKGSFRAASRWRVLIIYPLVTDIDAAAVRKFGGTVWHVGRPCDVPFKNKSDLFHNAGTSEKENHFHTLDALSESRARQRNYLSTLGKESGVSQ